MSDVTIRETPIARAPLYEKRLFSRPVPRAQSPEVGHCNTVPSVYVYNVSDYECFHNTVTHRTRDDFSVTYTKTALRLNLTSVDDFRSVIESLDHSGVEYHTSRLPAERPLSVIIRNVPLTMTEESIFNELRQLHFDVTLVTRLRNRHKNPIPIVAVLLTKSSTDIYSLDRLFHCVVSVEPRKRPKIVQCENCQRYYHTKNFCHLPPRCVKCAGDHHYSQCHVKRMIPPRCVNCGSCNHPANYKGCSYYRQILRQEKNRISGSRLNVPNPADKPGGTSPSDRHGNKRCERGQ